MELRQLEAFAAVMSTGSFTGAARLLDRSQPAITRLVQELEAEIGYTLFVRKGPRVTPSEAAFELHEDAERAIAGLRRISSRAREIASGHPPPLLISATSALAVGLLPQALQRLQASQALGAVQLRSVQPERVMQEVLGGSVHLGVSSLPLEHRGLDIHWIGELPCVAVLAESDPLAQQERVSVEALSTRRLLTLSNPYRLRNRLDAQLARASHGPALQRPPLIETNSSMNAQALVRAGLGVAILDPLTAGGAPLQGVVQRALDVHIPFFFGTVSATARPLPAAAQALSAALLDCARERSGFVAHAVDDHAALLQQLQQPDSPSDPKTPR